MEWQTVKEQERHGVAIYNYLEKRSHHVCLYVGETVLIYQELGDWYVGCKAFDKSDRGIFPKSYIRVRKDGDLQQPLVQEITAVVREWGSILKDLYVNNSEKVKDVENRIYKLIRFRSEILSGALPVDEMREMKHRVASSIDVGNHILGLDMVVRDEDCSIMNPESSSTIQLYWQHQKASENIKKQKNEAHRRSKSPISFNQHSHILFLCMRNFVCKVNEDVELLLYLYDGKEGEPFTESYVIRWSREGFVRDINQSHTLRALFTDLGSRDLEREKVYLVCHIIRLGAMEYRDGDKDAAKKATHLNSKKSYNLAMDFMRRPFGVAAMDITLYMSGKFEGNEDVDNFIPFFPCEKEYLEQTLKRALFNKDLTQKEHKGQGLWVSLKLLHGDLKQVREENPHLVLGNVAIARKIGFPEVILPGDVRNDLYLTLSSADFAKGSKTTDKNVQVTASVCNDKGQVIPDVIYLGGGVEALSEFKSVIYYHDDKPKWNEIFKVAVPIEEFKISHLKFTFKHRSSNEAKDKTEKPFALSYVKLMQENGTTLSDKIHNLCVYKIDHKKYDEGDVGYLSLPWCRTDEKIDKNHSVSGLGFSNKDSFCISTRVCSTKLTQNVDLLGLLNWSGHLGDLERSLAALMTVDGKEVVKYLQDVLDALFNILMQNSESELYDDLVFKCILYIIGLVADRKYQHFEPVLDVYIEESFSATLAYNKLMVVLKSYIESAMVSSEEKKDFYLQLMKSLQYIFRFIVRSRMLFSELYGGKGQEQFELSLKSLLNAIVELMGEDVQDVQHVLLIQGACVKYLPTAIPDILKVFKAKDLSLVFADLIKRIPTQKLVKQKMMTVNDLVKGPLFLMPESRAILLPAVTALVRNLLESRNEGRGSWTFRQQTKSAEKLSRVLGASGAKLVKAPQSRNMEVDQCVKVLSDIMELLYRDDIGPTIYDITEIMLTVLRTVIQTSISLEREHVAVAPLVVIMIAIFRQMSPHHFEAYVTHFTTIYDRLDFLMEILLVFKDLVSRPVFPKDWCDMIMLQNCVILKSLRFFSHTIRDYFFSPFEHQAWNNFFHCAIAFLTQPALQLESFSVNKRARIVSRYKDMRRDTGFEIRSMWFNLGQYKIQFIPGLVGAILEMTLIPEAELREATIPIFFDMMQCEFYSSKNSCDVHFTKRDSIYIKGNFSEFENEMIVKLDVLFEGGCGDEDYKNLFKSIMLNLCERHSSFRSQGVRFVKTVTRLMERLLEYRCNITDENKENRMSCTVNLLDFYKEIKRKEMYIRYVNKLCQLHLECDNYTEAAFTLELHSDLLSWTEEPLSPHLKSHKHPYCQTHLELKESLYYDSINYFDKGKMWECALGLCNELKEQYEEYLFDFNQLSRLHTTIARFYDCIMKQIRPEPEYFRVAFYGRGFPVHSQNKVFIYRGKEYERLSDFRTRMLNHLPNAELMSKLEPPPPEILESLSQYVQINKVDPVMDEKRNKFNGKRVPDQILKYHKVNNVSKFQFSRPVYQNGNERDNEFGNLWLERTVMVISNPLPGILTWFPVTSSKTFMMSPIETAIEVMDSTNTSLRELILNHAADPLLPLHPLSMKLQGIVDAAVMGGIANYEKAFFTDEYEEAHPEHGSFIADLKNSIAEQIPILHVGIQLHKQRAPPSLGPFHGRLEECFSDMQLHVESRYGKRDCDLKLHQSCSTVRRQMSSLSSTNSSSYQSEPRNSLVSLAPSETSLTSSSLKTLISIKTPSLPTATLKVKDRSKEKRKSKSRSKELSNVSLGESSNSQWYTGSEVSVVCHQSPASPQPVIELRQELTPMRPLRSEVERDRRLSRPTSGQFSIGKMTPSLSVTSRLSQTSIQSSNRDSTGTTESTTSEEDQIPPPLPAKQRESDYCTLSDASDRLRDASAPGSPAAWSRALFADYVDKPGAPTPTTPTTPPTPLPKPKSS